MKKVINPCKCEVLTTYSHKKTLRNAFVEIEYQDGNLSIHGVVAPLGNGNCLGSAGQCVDEIRKGVPTEKWTPEMLEKLCNIWDEWHLNDMRPYCKHMKDFGWNKQANEKVKVETWTLTKEAAEAKDKAEKRALECLRAGTPFYPTKDEIAYANMTHSVKVYDDDLDAMYKYGKAYRDAYELKEKDCLGRSMTKYQIRGWIPYKNHPLGLLGRPCPVCGYTYGSEWQKEEVPQDVINWLESLPDTDVKPAWI